MEQIQMYYSTEHASNLLGISARRLRDWIRDGKVKAIKYPASDRWMISKEEIERLMGNDNTSK